MFRFQSRLFGSIPSSTNKRSLRRNSRAKLILEELESRVTPSTITVTTGGDDPNHPFPQQTTLRDAITEANAAGGSSTITFRSTVTGTLQLAKPLPALSANITIVGPGAGALAISGGSGSTPPFGVFTIAKGAGAEIDVLGIQNGWLDDSTGNVQTGGGGVHNSGTLRLTDDIFENDSVFGTKDWGGAIYNTGTLYIKGCVISENSNSYNGGGGIYSNGLLYVQSGTKIYDDGANNGGGLYIAGGSVSITGGSQIYGSYATQDGGGMYIAGGTVTMSGGSVSGNGATNGNGGGVYNLAGTLTLKGGVTIDNNSKANEGGGLYLGSNSSTTFNGVTISGNTANDGVGYYQQDGAQVDVIDLYNPDGSDTGP